MAALEWSEELGKGIGEGALIVIVIAWYLVLLCARIGRRKT